MKSTLPASCEEHADVIHRMRERILKHYESKITHIILFGSFARGDWVYDRYVEDGIYYEYASDYDILVLTRTAKSGTVRPTATRLERSIEKKLSRLFPPYRPHSPNILVESIQRFNQELELGQYFFTDIKKEGICLYDSGEFPFKQARKLTNAELKEIAEKHFAQWFTKGSEFLEHTLFGLQKGFLNISAFQLHQAVESFANGTLLVLTGYKPKLHDIEKLLKLCASQSNEFLSVFPKGDGEKETCFELLKKAYIDARYNADYTISEAQLQYLTNEVEKLKVITEKVCQARIEALSKSQC